MRRTSKNSLRWVGFAAARYVTSRRRDKTAPSSLLPILGIAVGVLALTVILAVMNGFQLGFIDSILELSSFHVRAGPLPETGSDEALLRDLRGLPEIASAVPFVELQALAGGNRRSQQACGVRGLPADAPRRDPGLARRLEFEAGSFDLEDDGTVLLGAELARTLSVRLGDTVNLVSLAGAGLESLATEPFRVTGIFRTGFYQYDLGWAIIALPAARRLAGASGAEAYGIKLRNRWRDAAGIRAIRELESAATIPLESWRDYNRAFFGALRTEKLLMFVIVALIFVVVGLNIFQSQRRAVLERQDEIGLLRAVGASELAVRLVFTGDGLIIGALGATGGIIPGLLIATHIQTFFSLLEALVNGLIGVADAALAPFLGPAALGDASFRVFSPAVFYLKEIPSRVIPQEALLVFLFGLLSATAAAWLASGRVARIRPAEVLRYE